MNAIIGRKNEQKKLQNCLDSKSSEFVAIYGRRRIGKTFLMREFFVKRKRLLICLSNCLFGRTYLRLPVSPIW
jgi:AAA+ ATPase superfamily predicted ATPase